MRLFLFVFTILLFTFSYGKDAKPLAFPDYSDVSSKKNTATHSEPYCTRSDGRAYKRGTEGYSECMRPGKVKQTNYNKGKERSEYSIYKDQVKAQEPKRNISTRIRVTDGEKVITGSSK